MKKNNIRMLCYIYFLIFVCLVGPAFAAENITVEELIKKANLAAYYNGDDGKAKVKMTITDAQGWK